jgi:triose/dihydroxyacetone kinase / FAD-AMP lyase (cyclizing)
MGLTSSSGLGIHNEPGALQISPAPQLSSLVTSMLDMLLDAQDKERAFFNDLPGKPDEVILLINNLGGTTDLEMAAIAKETLKQLESRQVKVKRVCSGTFMVYHILEVSESISVF